MPWYRAGTVSVTLNNNTVTGTGTAFSANGRVGDAWTGPDGRWYEVTNIASNTVLTISPNYIGATTAAGSYALAPMQGYVKDSADQLRQIVNQWGATLAGLGTVSTENVVPLAKGGTGSTTAPAARTALGLGSAATLNAGSTPGSVMLAGDRASPLASTINTWGNSFQIWNNTTAGFPEANQSGTIINAAWTDGLFGTQILMSLSGKMFFRAGSYAASSMREVYHTGNTSRAADGTLKAI